jgi:hypothetical protein
MPRNLVQRFGAIEREIERQDREWAELERQMLALSKLGITIARSVVDEIDEAFSASSRAELSLHHTFC